MFKSLFSAMNEALDDIMLQYPSAAGTKQAELDEKLRVLRSMSDTCIEEWLLFEEKLGKMNQLTKPTQQNTASPSNELYHQAMYTEQFLRGQGYFKLLMFDYAAVELEAIMHQHADFSLGRLYLGLAYLKLDRLNEAAKQLNWLLPTAKNHTVKAIVYNALGCIYYEKDNLEKACEYFHLAQEADPSLKDALNNLQCCQDLHRKKQLSLQDGLELMM